jgi:hypothetical protein
MEGILSLLGIVMSLNGSIPQIDNITDTIINSKQAALQQKIA